jgi:hypothetical protein
MIPIHLVKSPTLSKQEKGMLRELMKAEERGEWPVTFSEKAQRRAGIRHRRDAKITRENLEDYGYIEIFEVRGPVGFAYSVLRGNLPLAVKREDDIRRLKAHGVGKPITWSIDQCVRLARYFCGSEYPMVDGEIPFDCPFCGTKEAFMLYRGRGGFMLKCTHAKCERLAIKYPNGYRGQFRVESLPQTLRLKQDQDAGFEGSQLLLDIHSREVCEQALSGVPKDELEITIPLPRVTIKTSMAERNEYTNALGDMAFKRIPFSAEWDTGKWEA